METLAIATAYEAYETSHGIQRPDLNFPDLKIALNSRWLAYIGVLLFGSQLMLGTGQIANAKVFSQPITNVTVNVNAGCLNIRMAPNGNKVDCLQKGTVLPDVVREEDGWYQLADGKWVKQEYVSGISVQQAVIIAEPAPAANTSIEVDTEPLQYVKDDMMQGEKIVRLQTRLNHYELLNKPIAVDGVFGRETKSAVLVFQGKRGLEMDGVVGQKTLKELELL